MEAHTRETSGARELPGVNRRNAHEPANDPEGPARGVEGGQAPRGDSSRAEVLVVVYRDEVVSKNIITAYFTSDLKRIKGELVWRT